MAVVVFCLPSPTRLASWAAAAWSRWTCRDAHSARQPGSARSRRTAA